jgi:hypothetical protein
MYVLDVTCRYIVGGRHDFNNTFTTVTGGDVDEYDIARLPSNEVNIFDFRSQQSSSSPSLAEKATLLSPAHSRLPKGRHQASVCNYYNDVFIFGIHFLQTQVGTHI